MNPSDERTLTVGFYSLLRLLQELQPRTGSDHLSVGVITNHLHQVTGSEMVHPAKAAVLGLCRVAAQENPNRNMRLPCGVSPAAGPALERSGNPSFASQGDVLRRIVSLPKIA